MANAAKKASASKPADKSGKKRTVLTPQQKLDKMKADLAEQEAKVAAKERASLDKLVAERDKLQTKVDEQSKKLNGIKEEIERIEANQATARPIETDDENAGA